MTEEARAEFGFWSRWGGIIVFGLALIVTLPTTGDLGATWDEPSYIYSQNRSMQWWERLFEVRSWSELKPLLDSDALIFYWPYGYYGINFHPPFAGQLNLLSHAMLGEFVNDMTSRRVATVVLFCLTVTMLERFLSRRYGPTAGLVAAGALLTMPRIYGHAHLAGTDTPGLMLWIAGTLAFWKGLNEPEGRLWRAIVGVILGLAFLEKMAAILVLMPMLLWLLGSRGWRAVALWQSSVRAAWVDGLLTLGLMAIPLVLCGWEILRLAQILPPPSQTDLMAIARESRLPGWLLAIPGLIWMARRLVRWRLDGHSVWGLDRPGLEILAAIAAWAPLIGWLGNPVWWRETLTRLAHYYLLNTDRRDALPDIQIIYFGEIYEYSLPWQSGFVLVATTVPLTILGGALLGVLGIWPRLRRDRLPAFLLLGGLILPLARMFPTPGHDGVRLFLPTFAMLAAFCGLGVAWSANLLESWFPQRSRWLRVSLGLLVIIPASIELARIHPFELSYYNTVLGGPAGASRQGMELTYWYDPYNDFTLKQINARLPEGASVQRANDISNTPTFDYLSALGEIRPDLAMGSRPGGGFPFVWLPTHHSKSSASTRLMYAMRPWYERRPDQLGGIRVASVIDPAAHSRAWALQLLLDAPAPVEEPPPRRNRLPSWVGQFDARLAEALEAQLDRLTGEGLERIPPLTINEEMFDWALIDPEGLRAAVDEVLTTDAQPPPNTAGEALLDVLSRYDGPGVKPSQLLLESRPEALREAIEILIDRPEGLRKVLLTPRYVEPDEIGGYLDVAWSPQGGTNGEVQASRSP